MWMPQPLNGSAWHGWMLVLVTAAELRVEHWQEVVAWVAPHVQAVQALLAWYQPWAVTCALACQACAVPLSVQAPVVGPSPVHRYAHQGTQPAALVPRP